MNETKIHINGQWIGRYTGTGSGLLVIDLDDLRTHYEGHVFAYNDNSLLPSMAAGITIPDKEAEFRLRLDLKPLNPNTGELLTWTQLAVRFPDTTFPRNAEVTLNQSCDNLQVSWTTDIGTSGTAELPKSQAGEPSECNALPNVTSWDQFKAYVNNLDPWRYIFHGQKELFRLRTGFHRTGRADLIRFLSNDVQTLHRHLSQRTSHIFNLSIPEQNGAFLSLAQHHGYPTPLLDWTYSPYVGAFFAYRYVKNSEALAAHENEKVRIFMFDRLQWCRDYTQSIMLSACRPHFSIMEFIAMDNERLVPQQSVSSVSSIDDIESYIRLAESDKQKYLYIIDLPLKERPLVMRELSMMGITAGSLFPGLDGACEELKERFFQG